MARKSAGTAAAKLKTASEPEQWATDGYRVWRAPGGPTVCTMGEPSQPSLFGDDVHQQRDAQAIVCLPRLLVALEECAKRLETCCHHTGTAAEYAHQAVKGYRDLLAEARGQKPRGEGV
jgi:hypothetical protein